MNLLYLSGIILSFFLALILLTKKNKTGADFILMVWLMLCGWHLTAYYLTFTKQHVLYPHFFSLGMPLPLVQGPCLYLYTRHQTSAQSFKLYDALHLIPFILFYLFFAEFYTLSGAEKIAVYNANGDPYNHQLKFYLYFVYVSGVIYILLSLWRLYQYRRDLVNQFSNTEKINFNWLLYLIIWLGFIWVLIIFVKLDEFIFAAAALFVLWLGYFGIKQVQVFSQSGKSAPFTHSSHDPLPPAPLLTEDSSIEDVNQPSKYQKSTLSESDQKDMHNQLQNLFATEKPHLNPELTLSDLANSLHTHPNYLSQVINSLEKKNFYDLVNQKRIEEFLKLSSDPSSHQFTLLANAFACGFNSKASFNRNFKKHTGFTPSEYLKRPL